MKTLAKILSIALCLAMVLSFATVAFASEEEVTIPEAIEIAKENNGKMYVVSGTITKVDNTTWGNMYIADADGNELYIYGLYGADGTPRYDEMEVKPVAGDQVTLLGELTTYKETSQMKNARLVAHTPGNVEPEPEPDPVAISIVDANAKGAAMEHNTYTAEKYIVTGVVAEVQNTQYGNMYIQDAEGNKLFVYGVNSPDGARYDKMDPQPVVGDTVTLVGIIGQYNGNPQMKEAVMTALVPGNVEPEPEADPVEISIADANAKGAAMEHNTYTTEKYIVTGVIVEITSDKYGNMYIQDAEGNKLFVYGVNAENGDRYDAMANQPKVGDTVTLVGVIGQYNDNPQMKNAVMTARVPANPSETGDVILLAVCGLLVSGGALAILPKKRAF